jgi:ABC-type dipeptide/oligopeptide/nickel transport system ATPase subunit
MRQSRIFRKLEKILILNHEIGLRKKELDQLVDQLEESQEKLKEIKKGYRHYLDLYGGLLTVKSELGKDGQADNEKPAVFLREIGRLQDKLGLYREIKYKTSFLNPTVNLKSKPLVFNLNLARFLKDFKKFLRRNREFSQLVGEVKEKEENFILKKSADGVIVDRDETEIYKPDSLRVRTRHVLLNNKFLSTYFLSELPAFLSPHLFFRLISSSLPFTLSLFIEPSGTAGLIKRARQRLSILEMQQNERLEKGKTADSQINKNMEEVSLFIDDLVHEVERGLIFSLYLEIAADNLEELARLHKELKDLTDSSEIIFSRSLFDQQKAWQSTLPFNNDVVGQNRIIQSTAASYLMPFIAKQNYDPEGVLLGVNAYHDSLIFLNPFTVRNSNVTILGVSGSGKSVTAKALASRLYMRGVQIIIIDPEGEYVEFARAMKGEVIQFSRDNGFNPFFQASENPGEVLDQVTMLKTFFKFFIPDNKFDGAKLDSVLVNLFSENEPSFEKFLSRIKDSSMYPYLNVLSEGSLKGIFNADSAIRLNSDLIVFDISMLGEDEKKNPAMYLLTSLVWNLVNKSKKRKMLFIDEAHKLLVNEGVAVFYREIVKQARKRNLGVVSISQDVEDFLGSQFGKAVLNNSETKILLKQSYAALPLMGNIFPMTTEEKQALGFLNIGEIVLFREHEHLRADILVLPSEEKYVFTR